MKKKMFSAFILALLFGSLHLMAGNGKKVARLGAVVSSTNTDFEIYPTGCSFTFPFHITLTNLGTFAPAESGGFEYLPTNYPPMYLEYSVDDQPIVRVPITQFEYIGVALGVPLYEAVVHSDPIDFGNFCNTNGASSFYQMLYSSRLVTHDPSSSREYPPYPIDDYKGVCDIFSCLVNQETNCSFSINPDAVPICSEGMLIGELNNGGSHPGVLDKLGIAPATGTAEIYCGACNPPGSESGHHSNDKKFSAFTAIPNPFSESFDINWNNEQSPENLLLYDTSGRLVKQWGESELAYKSGLSVNADDLQKGIYFLQINTGTEHRTIKIIKQ